VVKTEQETNPLWEEAKRLHLTDSFWNKLRSGTAFERRVDHYSTEDRIEFLSFEEIEGHITDAEDITHSWGGFVQKVDGGIHDLDPSKDAERTSRFIKIPPPADREQDVPNGRRYH